MLLLETFCFFCQKSLSAMKLQFPSTTSTHIMNSTLPLKIEIQSNQQSSYMISSKVQLFSRFSRQTWNFPHVKPQSHRTYFGITEAARTAHTARLAKLNTRSAVSRSHWNGGTIVTEWHLNPKKLRPVTIDPSWNSQIEHCEKYAKLTQGFCRFCHCAGDAYTCLAICAYRAH